MSLHELKTGITAFSFTMARVAGKLPCMRDILLAGIIDLRDLMKQSLNFFPCMNDILRLYLLDFS